ncbi:hypothetical protein PG997_009408 [Apiospora hydei]|uniref:DUF6594 domain-containing protein n=1 Tax=Apiospora hydei TaxID=1337664 RepID=A0ABR1VU09_9PEZI
MATGLNGIPLGNPTRGGYTRLASFMGDYPKVAIFKRFSSLSTLSLLHMQAELEVLQKELQEQVKVDSLDPNRARCDLNWQDLISSASCADDEGSRQWEILQKITKLLHDYRKTLLQQHELYKIASPAKPELNSLRAWMEFEQMGNIWLSGPDREIWTASPPFGAYMPSPGSGPWCVREIHRPQTFAMVPSHLGPAFPGKNGRNPCEAPYLASPLGAGLPL